MQHMRERLLDGVPFVLAGIVAVLVGWLTWQEVRLERQHQELHTFVVRQAEARMAVDRNHCNLTDLIATTLTEDAPRQAVPFRRAALECRVALRKDEAVAREARG
ncbi:MAG: hypothetical protein KGL39_42275 [Patescibacteria group bacterium]|nr:hypothetical protein [Patescibacteria group bacterium]